MPISLSRSRKKPNQNKSTDSSDKGVDVVLLMVDSLPNELAEPQRNKVRKLSSLRESTTLAEPRWLSTESMPGHIDQFGSHFADTHSSIWKKLVSK